MNVRVAWRTGGRQLSLEDQVEVLRFEVSDLNQVIKASVAASPLYVPLHERTGLSPHHRVLPVSCFVVTPRWSPARLAEGTGYRSYRQVESGVLIRAGFPLWPTEIHDDNGPDARNEVHFDVIVASGFDLPLRAMAVGSRSERAAARDLVAPAFRALLDLMGEPRTLFQVPR